MKPFLVFGAVIMAAVSCQAQPPKPAPENAGQAINPALHVEKVDDPALAGFPIAPGWPLALPGSVTGTPVLADIDGDDEYEIIVPCMQAMRAKFPLINTAPSTDAQLWAFKADGRVVKNWPVVLAISAERELAKTTNPQNFDEWSASPSVAPGVNGDSIVINGPDSGNWSRRVWRVSGRGTMQKISAQSDPWACMPLADVNKDGVLDVIAGGVLATANGEWGVPGWPDDRRIPGGFAPTIGDANGDGKLDIYHPDYPMSYHETPPKPQGTISGFDTTGKPLPGWPVRVAGGSQFVVMGDVSGDDAMEICTMDGRKQLHVLTWDGKAAPGTSTVGEWIGVLKSPISATTTPLTLADLNGDGKAEIIYFDTNTRNLMAWHGDGKGVYNEEGIVCTLPQVLAVRGIGVTVANLGGDGVMDLFCGTSWIKVAKDGATTITPLLPKPGFIASHVTICDIDGDGNAELLFGLADGRVFLYKTGMSIKPEGLQWPTQSGNFQHTGAWKKPTPRLPN